MFNISTIIFFLFIFLTSKQFSAAQINLRRRLSGETVCSKVIQPAGYPCTEYTVQTKDGYILAIQRVSSSDRNQSMKLGPPVLLVHGIFVAGDCFFLNFKDESLGFILADAGFDVWVANVRGTSWGGHKSLSPEDKEFWNWSWPELALYDLPAMIQHVYSTTDSKIFIVGHSQGTLTTMTALTQPNIAEMVEAAALLCPISYLDRMNAVLAQKMVSFHFDEVIAAMGLNKFELKWNFILKLVISLCNVDSHCIDLLDSLTGGNSHLNSSRMNFYFGQTQPTSVKNLRHYFQMIREGTISKFDYGTSENLKVYGQEKPPAFNLSLIPKSLPLWMGYGGIDAIADVTDIQHALSNLQSNPELLYLKDYGHLDFLWSIQGKEDVFSHVIGFFKSLGKSS